MLKTLSHMLERVRDICGGPGGSHETGFQRKSQDELGELARSFNRFLEKLHDMIGEVAGDTWQTGWIERENVALRGRNRPRKARTARRDAACGDGSGGDGYTVEEVSRNSTEAAAAARQASEIAHAGGVTVKETQEQIPQSLRESGRSGRAWWRAWASDRIR